MTGIRWLMAVGLGALIVGDACAQFFPPPVPVFMVPVVVPDGIGFRYNSRRLQVGGFFGTGNYSPAILPVTPNGMPLAPGQPFFPVPVQPIYPPFFYPPFYPSIYGVRDTRVTLQVINPPVLVPGRRAEDFVDLSGIDLDVEPVANLWEKKPAGKNQIAQKKVAKGEPVKVAAAERAAPAAKVAAQAPPPPAPPKVDPIPAWKQQIDNGVAAFRNEDFGIALLRFRQLADDNPAAPRVLFLQGEAYLAVGKFQEAAESIQKGLQRDPAWRHSDFRPKAELYANDAGRRQQMVKRLEQAQRQQPKNADLLFLLGYVYWFDGQRDVARDFFRQSRVLANDTQWCDLFLQAK